MINPYSLKDSAFLDVYDSLTSTRPYRPAMAEGDIYRILDEGRGTMFDPLVLDIFLEVIKKRHDI